MGTPRRLGVVFCLFGFLAVCVLSLMLGTSRPFGGLAGIESDLEDDARALLAPDAPGAVITADGRDLSVQLPDLVAASFDMERVENSLRALDGVRSVELIGLPTIAVGPDEAPDPLATVPPETMSEPEPTEEPVPEPTSNPEPTSEPVPTEAPEPTSETEPTEAPEPTAPTEEPTPVPLTLSEVVEDLDLGEVEFEPGSATFTVQDTAVLDVVADQLQGFSDGNIEVQAHTDDVGDPDVNLLLSRQRAETVVAYLTDRGVDAALLTPRGYGSQLPIADNDTEQGRAANQRVALVVEGN